MSREDAFKELSKALENVDCESITDLFVFACGFFIGKGLEVNKARSFALDASALGYYPHLYSVEAAANAV